MKKKREPSYRRMETVVEIPIYGLHDNNHSSLCISFLYVLFSFSYRIYRRWQQQILQEFRCHLLAWQNSDRRRKHQIKCCFILLHLYLAFFMIEIWSVGQTAAKILNISRLNSAHKSSRLHLIFSFSFLIQELPTRKPSKAAVLCWIGLLILKQPRPATFWWLSVE